MQRLIMVLSKMENAFRNTFVFEYKDTDFMASPLSMVWST